MNDLDKHEKDRDYPMLRKCCTGSIAVALRDLGHPPETIHRLLDSINRQEASLAAARADAEQAEKDKQGSAVADGFSQQQPSPAELAVAEQKRKFAAETDRLTKVQAEKDALAEKDSLKARAAALAARSYPNHAGKGGKDGAA